MRYFIALAHPNGEPDLVRNAAEDDNGDGAVALFTSKEKAEEIARLHPAAQAWGYEIYPWPHNRRTER